ncbi:alkane 1-monooxygenase AlkB2 [Pseudomonas aeruginosa]|uniref:alkane 1-monooxygenase AlkB2 n=1 Tax=Pseudomonas aeruginosa TaxID=287 RepID=UPI00053F083F|nr:alkane 1-monooxygenase AlkB2 [Pseudomonas aeruginosa]HCL3370294.1 alkane 1-monooxygenase [Pseudomonas aeruginosa]HCL3745628.1 alkane 1-monooxygenase [Pseudomonas aeruginosa]HCU2536764.1 alkane 1-monooxygenase [Pseudomonas aeruginosa]HEJ1944367.1 alkane 1-monooxygenase [Pseudomonas aeruginosa]HEJ3363727.1 alkane 1-monooxygenase [Pseudomonas aeruginosa]
MFASLSSAWMLRLKKYGYWIWLIAVLGIPLSYWWSLDSDYPNAWPWLVISVVFGLIPILDAIVGRDPANPEEASEVPEMEAQGYYRVLSLATVPLLLGMLVWSGWILAQETRWDWVGQLGWILSVGTVMGAIGITVSHELIHKDPRLEQNAGGLLLAAVCYAGFKVEHVRGHHVHVSTPEDASSSRYGQSLYSFLPHAYKHNFLNAWRLEAERLKRKGLPALHWRNELIWWYAISALFLLGFSLAFGWLGAIFFLGQSVMAFTLLEIVNYVEHYGLHRRRLDNGRYERTTPEHSWNSNFLLTNLFLFHLQRHSDHHAYAKRRYQVLRHYDSSPQLPNGYAGMIVLALFPPLWRAVMDPKVRAYYAGEEYQLTDTQRI